MKNKIKRLSAIKEINILIARIKPCLRAKRRLAYINYQVTKLESQFLPFLPFAF